MKFPTFKPLYPLLDGITPYGIVGSADLFRSRNKHDWDICGYVFRILKSCFIGFQCFGHKKTGIFQIPVFLTCFLPIFIENIQATPKLNWLAWFPMGPLTTLEIHYFNPK